MNKIIKDVCGALIEEDGKFLVARRRLDDSFGGLWEFPGGALEEGETKEEGLKREIKEELGIDIEVGRLVLVFEDEIPGLKIKIYLYKCKIKNGKPHPIDCEDVRWVSLAQLSRLKLASADKKIYRWIKRYYTIKKVILLRK